MAIRLIFLNRGVSDGVDNAVLSYWIESAELLLPGNSHPNKVRTKTDTGG